MPFGLEEIPVEYDIVITASTTELANFIVIQPLIDLPLSIKSKIKEINSLHGWRVGKENGSYYLYPPTTSDCFALAEKVAMGLEAEKMKIQRISQRPTNLYKSVTCQSFILA